MSKPMPLKLAVTTARSAGMPLTAAGHYAVQLYIRYILGGVLDEADQLLSSQVLWPRGWWTR